MEYAWRLRTLLELNRSRLEAAGKLLYSPGPSE